LKITTTTEAQTISDISSEWKIVAYREGGRTGDLWRYTGEIEDSTFRGARDGGTLSSVQGRDRFGRLVVYARVRDLAVRRWR
jgi:hypothetical protein